MSQSSVPPSGKATVDALADQWAKLLSIAMHKLGHDHIVISEADIDAIGADGKMEKCIVVQELKDGIHLRLMPTAEAIAFAKQHKGGFGKS